MKKRYQVFVSSTYVDLQQERQHVIQTLMEMDCIPAGMELFPAADEEQLTFIKKVIDDCDYYLLIIGGRYGSLDSDGISYTEKEYDYAVETGIPIVALIHGEPGQIPLNKTEGDEKVRQRLADFKEKVSKGRLVKEWRNAADLPGLVSLSLNKTIKTRPGIGWTRGDTADSHELLSEINELRKSNDQLQESLKELPTEPLPPPEDIAGLDEDFLLWGKYLAQGRETPWTCSYSWRRIFSTISPYLAAHPNEYAVKEVLRKAVAETTNLSNLAPSLDDQVFQTVSIQLQAHGLVNVSYTPDTQGRMGLFWSATPKGERQMLDLRIGRTKLGGLNSQTDAPAEDGDQRSAV